jgi:hypothetical protein
MSTEPETTTLAREAQDEISRDAEALGEQLKGEIGEAGATALNQDQYHAYIRSRWGDALWRQKFYADVGPQHFWTDSHAAWGLPAPRVTKAMVGEE